MGLGGIGFLLCLSSLLLPFATLPFPLLLILSPPFRYQIRRRDGNFCIVKLTCQKRSPFRAPAWAKPMGQTHLEFVYVCMCALCARLEPLGAALASRLSTVPLPTVPKFRSLDPPLLECRQRDRRGREANRRRRRRGSPPLPERKQSVTEYANAPFPTATVHV